MKSVGIHKKYIDYLRIIASMAVVMLHSASMKWSIYDYNTFEWKIFNAYDSIVRWGVPIFFMISGALFLSRDIEIQVIIKKYVKHLLIIFYFWSFGYAMLMFFITKSVETFISTFLGGYYHQWYLHAAIGLYLATPILRKIVVDKKICRYFIVLSLLFSFFLSMFSSVFAELGFEHANNYMTSICLSDIPCYFGYYVLGYYLDNFQIEKKSIYVLGLLGVFFTGTCNLLVANIIDAKTSVMYANKSPLILFTAVAIFVFVKYNTNSEMDTLTERWGKYTMAIYLVHPFFQIIVDKFCFSPDTFNPIISTPLFFVATYILSMLFAIVANKIAYVNKWFI